MKNDRVQTPEEEKINVLTHGLGIVFTLITTVCVFGFGMLATYLSSTIYHAVTNPVRKEFWHICDHICIFLLIGGTYTPVIFRHIPFDEALFFMATMWGIIALGIVFKLFFTGKYEWFSLLLYVFLGWMLIFVAKPIGQTMSPEVLKWILYGIVLF
jgi:hemolysin III